MPRRTRSTAMDRLQVNLEGSENTPEAIEEALAYKFPYAITTSTFGPELSTPVCEFIRPIISASDPYVLQTPHESAIVYLTRLPTSHERMVLKHRALEDALDAHAKQSRKKRRIARDSDRGQRIQKRVDSRIDENLKLARTVLLQQMALDHGNHLQSLRFSPSVLHPSFVAQPTLYRQQDGYPNKMYIAGASLCGKSYFAALMARNYLTHFPNRRVVIFSVVPDDPVYAALKQWTQQSLHRSADEPYMRDVQSAYYPKVFKRAKSDKKDDASETATSGDDDAGDMVEWTSQSKVLFFPLDDSIVTDPPPLSLFKNTLCIFDDVESGVEKSLLTAILSVRDSLINTGRHHQVDVIVARQQLLDFGKTRTLLNNIYQVVGFPQSAGKHHFIAFLERYMGLSKQLIEKIKSIPSRWILINRAQPQYVLSQSGITFL